MGFGSSAFGAKEFGGQIGSVVPFGDSAATFTLTGEVATFQTREAAAQASFVLTGEAAALRGQAGVSFGAFALTGEAVTVQAQLRAIFGAYALAGQTVAFDPSEPVSAGM